MGIWGRRQDKEAEREMISAARKRDRVSGDLPRMVGRGRLGTTEDVQWNEFMQDGVAANRV